MPTIVTLTLELQEGFTTMKPSYIIAIDPDAKASGIALLDVADRKLIRCECMCFPELIEYVKKECYAVQPGVKIDIYIEASWLTNTANHHKGYRDKDGVYKKNSERINENISNKTGRNQETGRKIVEMLRFYGMPVEEVIPLRKCWSGPDRKISQGEIEQFIPGFPKRSTQDARDAALLAWDKANFPIRIKVQPMQK